jgi:glycosyltransferase involved in cell wall biosynthesis
LRFVDAGFKVAQLDQGFVHHKYMPSHIRNESKVLTSWHSVIKNKTYFSLRHAREHRSLDQIMAAIHATIAEFRAGVRWAVGENKLGPEYLDRFETEVDRALQMGLERGLADTPRTAGAAAMRGVGRVVRFAPHLEAAQQRCYVLLSKTYPPGSVGGIGRYIHQLAREIAALGHQVHVLTESDAHDRVDFEDGVWVHRIRPRECRLPSGMSIPASLWNYSRTMFEEALEIGARRTIDAVYAPVWDLEGIAFLEAGAWPLVTSLQTTMASYLDANRDKQADRHFMDSFARPVLALEKRLMRESGRIHAISDAIVTEIEQQYGFRFARDKLDMVPLGLADWSGQPAQGPAPLAAGVVRLCFIGRMELRKGADVFLALAPRLLQEYPALHIDLVGNDTIVQADGKTMRARFEQAHPDLVAGGRIVFHGNVADAALRGFYREADLVVAPSRFESFGLVHLEAMMFGKAVIGCKIGGMPEVIAEGKSGLLAEPGDVASLHAAIARLLGDRDYRTQLAAGGRARYLAAFQPQSMAAGVLASLRALPAVA